MSVDTIKKRRSFSYMLAAPLVVTMLGGGALLFEWSPSRAVAQETTPQVVEGMRAAKDLSSAFQRVAEIITPSVVSIRSTHIVQAGTRNNDDPFRRFFGGDSEQPQQPRQFEQKGLGSGFIVTKDGYIMTNNHVVAEADAVTVVLSDNREFEATVVGTDPQSDLALLKIDASGLKPVTFGESNNLRVGQWVIAAGNPFGLTSSITAGIVSAVGRSYMGITDYEDFIQTDAAINPGNSGGPLVNLAGEVVGVNTAIFTRNQGNMGIGFAIPSSMAHSVMDSLRDNGRVVRGFLGVNIQNFNADMARTFGYDQTFGALVGRVVPDSPAEKAGLREGDIITELNGETVKDVSRLRLNIAAMSPGDNAQFEVFRNGKKRNVSIELGELPYEPLAMARGPVEQPGRTETGLGMTVETLTPQISQQLGYESSLNGVVVTGVERSSPAAKAQIERGVVITKVQDDPVTSVREFRDLLKRHDMKEGVRLTIRQGGGQRFVLLKSE